MNLYGPDMDAWRYKIVGHQMSRVNSESDEWMPGFMVETEIIWEEEVAEKSLEKMRELFPEANVRIQKTRDRWEEVQ